MTEVTFAVRGEHTEEQPAQEAVVDLEITAEGASMAPAHDAVAAGVVTVVADLGSRDGVAEHSVDAIRTWADRPWGPDGQQRDLVHHASVSIRVCFDEVAAVGPWVATTSTVPGASVGHIDWRLTQVDRIAIERRCRTAALLEARTRAQDYADALGLGAVVVRSVSDPGVGPEPVARAMKAMSADSGGVDLAPRPVAVTASVEAVFVVQD